MKKGRPKKPEKEVREKTLRIRLTDEERGALDDAAAHLHLDTSTWARMRLLQLAKEESGKRGS